METQAKTFILTKTKTWSREVRVFIMDQNKKYVEKLLPFTTEQIVNSKQRNTRGHNVPAQYITADPVIIAALYRDSAYGKDFVELGDPEGKKKQPTIVINDSDRKLVALRGLFKYAGLQMDESLPYDVLREQYEIHMIAVAGRNKESKPAEIPHTPTDVKATIEQGIAAARQKYEDLFGDPIPAIVENDLAFLDGLSNPAFDAQKYIENKILEANKPENEPAGETHGTGTPTPSSEKDYLHQAYFTKFAKNVPLPKTNDLAWIKAKLEE